MAAQHADKDGIQWVHGDVRDMKSQIPDDSVDVAFDKGTLDAMISGSPWDPPKVVRENVGRYLDEVCASLFIPLYVLRPPFGQSIRDDGMIRRLRGDLCGAVLRCLFLCPILKCTQCHPI